MEKPKFDIGDRVTTPFSDRVLTIVDMQVHTGHHEGVQEVDYQTDDGEWHYDGWYFKRANDEQTDRTD